METALVDSQQARFQRCFSNATQVYIARVPNRLVLVYETNVADEAKQKEEVFILNKSAKHYLEYVWTFSK